MQMSCCFNVVVVVPAGSQHLEPRSCSLLPPPHWDGEEKGQKVKLELA